MFLKHQTQMIYTGVIFHCFTVFSNEFSFDHRNKVPHAHSVLDQKHSTWFIHALVEHPYAWDIKVIL